MNAETTYGLGFVALALAVLLLLLRYQRRWGPPARSLVIGGGRMTRAQQEDFTKPADMSDVRRELAEMEDSEEFARYRSETELRKRRIGAGAPLERPLTPRPADDTMTDEEREILAQTDARSARR